MVNSAGNLPWPGVMATNSSAKSVSAAPWSREGGLGLGGWAASRRANGASASGIRWRDTAGLLVVGRAGRSVTGAGGSVDAPRRIGYTQTAFSRLDGGPIMARFALVVVLVTTAVAADKG